MSIIICTVIKLNEKAGCLGLNPKHTIFNAIFLQHFLQYTVRRLCTVNTAHPKMIKL